MGDILPEERGMNRYPMENTNKPFLILVDGLDTVCSAQINQTRAGHTYSTIFLYWKAVE
jgi:hypothetical protein